MSKTLKEHLEIAHSQLGVPAIGGGIVRRGEQTCVEVFGNRRRTGDPDLARIDDAWHIGSCFKVWIAAVWGRLVDQGMTTWEAPLESLFPDLTVHPDLRGTDIQTVMMHRSGLPANLSRAETRQAIDDERTLSEQRTELATRCLSQAPKKVGNSVYSNLSYIMAGAAIERVSGHAFEETIQREILDPLQITSAGFGPPPAIAGHRGLLAAPIPLGKGPPLEPDDPHADNPPVYNSAGRLHLNLSDWARFLRIFVEPDQTLLSPETLARLIQPEAERPFFALGWAKAQKLDGVSLGQMGSNTYWLATALLNLDRTAAAFVVWNDGRWRLFRHGPRVAHGILSPN